MYITWENGRPLADREMVAKLCEVSERTVRRHCTPARREPRTGRTDGRHGGGGMVLYDAFTAAEDLAGVSPRPGVADALRRLRPQ